MSETIPTNRSGIAPTEVLTGLLERVNLAREEVARTVIGQENVIEQLFISLMCAGHVLVEGAPGLGKTLLIRTVGTVCGMHFSRIQFTPDLMPADITGTIALIHDEKGNTLTRFQPGPVFAQMVLTDEINRATPKTQSALLEAMQERTVTVAGEEYPLPRPFFVLATQNPIEMEGTYVLPEAQVDRFFCKVVIPFPAAHVLDAVLQQTTGKEVIEPAQMLTPEDVVQLQAFTREVPVPAHVREAVVRLILASQPDDPTASPQVKRFIQLGISPRGAQALLLAGKARALLQGRFNVSFEDVVAVALPTLRHRVQLNFEGEAEDVVIEEVLQQLVQQHLADSKE